MNHPQPEEWVPYVFGEADAGARTRLKEHLRDCPECRQELQTWKRSLGRLDAWRLPAAERPRESFEPTLRWALAAALVLAFGFGLGRFSAPSGLSLEALRAQMTAEVKAALGSALKEQVRPAWADQLSTELARSQEETSNSLAALESRLGAATDLRSRQLLRSVAELLEQGRAQDRQAVLALFRELEEQHTASYVALRKDLETLASLTDTEMRQARLRLTELAGSESPTP